MRSIIRWFCVTGVLSAALGFAVPLRADPPARIGQLNLIEGTVSFEPPTVNQWAPAQLNYPLTTGDRLWTDVNSRAEMHIGSTQIQLAPQTDFSLLDLENRTAQIQLAQGAIDVRIRHIGDNEAYEVDTPNCAVSLLRPGLYRVEVNSQSNTIVTDREGGQAEVSAAGSAFTVYGDQSAQITGTDSPSYNIVAAPPPDGFDQWAMAQDGRDDHILSVRYVSSEMTGYEDLDSYGTWRYVGPYGWCWGPRVAVGWAPYRFGHWCWESPWGWTWIDDAPWGFAPCHYGRWVFVSDWGWLWVPGPIVESPCYAPALVAFVGGGNWSLSLAFGGSVGWFPLGPGEVWVPPYRVSRFYAREVNYGIRNVNFNFNMARAHYANFRTPGAVTMVPQRAFQYSEPANRFAVRVDPRKLSAARIVGAAPAVVPRPHSVLAHPSGLFERRAPAPPAAIQNRVVVVRRIPPRPAVPFLAQERALERHPGRPLSSETLNQLRPYAPVPHQQVRMAIQARAGQTLHAGRPGLPPAHPVRPVPEPRAQMAARSPAQANPSAARARPPAQRAPAPTYRNQRAAAPPARNNAPAQRGRPPAQRAPAPTFRNQRAAAPSARNNAPAQRGRPPAERAPAPTFRNQRAAGRPPARYNAPAPRERPPAERAPAPTYRNQRAAGPPARGNTPAQRGRPQEEHRGRGRGLTTLWSGDRIS